jgi:hypothetical protein
MSRIKLTVKVSSILLLSLSHSVVPAHSNSRATGVASSGSETVLRYLSGVTVYVLIIVPVFLASVLHYL